MTFHVLLVLCLLILVKSESNENHTIKDKGNLKSTPDRFVPTWESLDSRKLPDWYQDAKIGVFLHWGVYSVPSFDSEWFWDFWKSETNSGRYHNFMKKNYKPGFTYQEFARDFTAEFFNAAEWAQLFEAAGAKYVVLTSKHHEGYTLWPSKYSFGWNSMDVGPHRDLVGELADAVKRRSDLHFGIYHSLFEWYNPMWLEDQKNNFTTERFVLGKVLPEMFELVENYRPEIFWSDGAIRAPDTYWKSKEFIAYLYNDSPVKDTVVVNDRWGTGLSCKHGDFYTCVDRYNPGHLLLHKWENAMSIDKGSFGYRRNAVVTNYMTTTELIKELASTVSCNGNLLINIGPTKDGIIPPIFQDRLREFGKWLKVNGEAIYGTRPWQTQNDTITGDTWYTLSKNLKTLYAIVLTWPEDDVLQLGALDLYNNYTFSILGYPGELTWRKLKDKVEINLPPRAHRGRPAWVVKIEFNSDDN